MSKNIWSRCFQVVVHVFQAADGPDERGDEGLGRSLWRHRSVHRHSSHLSDVFLNPERTAVSPRLCCCSSGDDETFQDIFRDFSDMASHDPEKLSRRRFSRGGEEEGDEEAGSGGMNSQTSE